MKKFYLMLLGAMFTMTAAAQQGKGGLVLDSARTFNADNVKTELTIMEYDANKRITATYGYDCVNEQGTPVYPPVLTDKSEVAYNAQGYINLVNLYSYKDGKYTLSSTSEMSNFNASGTAGMTVMKAVDSENPSGGLQNSMKIEVTAFAANGAAATEKTYTWEEGEWTLMMTTTTEYNADGTVKTETADMGGGYTMVTTYEYDDNGNKTKKTSSMGGFYSTVTEYTNEYYADGNLKKVVIAGDGNPSTEEYFWGNGQAKGGVITAIGHINRQKEQMQRIYDLQGRSVAVPAKGLYIVGGKKIVKK